MQPLAAQLIKARGGGETHPGRCVNRFPVVEHMWHALAQTKRLSLWAQRNKHGMCMHVRSPRHCSLACLGPVCRPPFLILTTASFCRPLVPPLRLSRRPAAPTAAPRCAVRTRPPRRRCAATRRVPAWRASCPTAWPAWQQRTPTETTVTWQASWRECSAGKLQQSSTGPNRSASLMPHSYRALLCPSPAVTTSCGFPSRPTRPHPCRPAAARARQGGVRRADSARRRGGAARLHGAGKRRAGRGGAVWRTRLMSLPHCTGAVCLSQPSWPDASSPSVSPSHSTKRLSRVLPPLYTLFSD